MLYDDTEFVQTVQRIIEFLGTFAFAISGIRHAAAKNFDWFGGFVCGVAVAIGGVTIRDVMLGVVPFCSFLDDKPFLFNMHRIGSGICNCLSSLIKEA